jgi:hypothetical protein
MKKIFRRHIYFLITTLSVLSFSSSMVSPVYAAASPGTNSSWQSASNLPDNTTRKTSVSYRGFVYAIGGESPGNLTYIAQIQADGSLGTWTTSPKLLPQNRSWHSSVIVGNYIYAMGGLMGLVVDTVYYTSINSDGTINNWQSATNLPQTIYGSSAVTYNNYIYMIGGWIGETFDASNKIYYTSVNSDGTIGSWNTATNLPLGLSDVGSTLSNGYIYVVGGVSDALHTVNSVYYSKVNSDGTIGSWNLSSNALPQSLYFPQIQSYHGYIFSVGGNNYPNAVASVYSAPLGSDGSVGAWTLSANSLPAPSSHATSSVYNGIMYNIGGLSSSNVYYSTLTGYNPPSLQSISSNVASGSSKTFDVFSMATNNPSRQSLSIVSSPSHGRATISDGVITYYANSGYSGSDSFTYTLCSVYDATNCSQATINITITSSPYITTNTGFGLTSSTYAANDITYLILGSFTLMSLGLIIRRESDKK